MGREDTPQDGWAHATPSPPRMEDLFCALGQEWPKEREEDVKMSVNGQVLREESTEERI